MAGTQPEGVTLLLADDYRELCALEIEAGTLSKKQGLPNFPEI